MKTNKTIIIILISIIFLVGLLFGGYKFSKSRKFQYTGEIINRVNTEEKVIALTFDDGPTEKTEEILSVLANLDIKATFFLTGKEIELRQNDTKTIVDAGHEIGNHSYSHARMMFKSKEFIDYEIDKTEELIRKAGYRGKIYFRAPFCKKLFILPLALKKRDITHITFDVEPDTYLDAGKNPKDVADYVIDNVKPGSIVLMHVMYENGQRDIDALPFIVSSLKNKGYRFLTISEMMNYRK